MTDKDRTLAHYAEMAQQAGEIAWRKKATELLIRSKSYIAAQHEDVSDILEGINELVAEQATTQPVKLS